MAASIHPLRAHSTNAALTHVAVLLFKLQSVFLLTVLPEDGPLLGPLVLVLTAVLLISLCIRELEGQNEVCRDQGGGRGRGR